MSHLGERNELHSVTKSYKNKLVWLDRFLFFQWFSSTVTNGDTNKCDRKIFAVTEKKSRGVISQSLTYTLKVRENHSELVDGHDNFTRVKMLVRTHLTMRRRKSEEFQSFFNHSKYYLRVQMICPSFEG